MLIRQPLDRLQLNEKASFRKDICDIIAQHRPILVINLKRILLINSNSRFPTPMDNSIFVDLFEVSVSEILMQLIADLPHLIDKSEYFLLCSHPFCALCAFLRQPFVFVFRSYLPPTNV